MLSRTGVCESAAHRLAHDFSLTTRATLSLLLLLLLATLRKPPSVIIAMCGAGKAIKTWIHLSKDMAKEVAMGEDSGVYTVTRPPPVYFATAWQGRLHHSLAKPDSAKTEPADYKLDRGCT